MPLNAVGWSDLEDINLVEWVKPHSSLYNALHPSRKNILERESTWLTISKALNKPVEECKKRWRGIRDGFMRNKRLGKVPSIKNKPLYEKLQFLNGTSLDSDGSDVVMDENVEETVEVKSNEISDSVMISEQEAVADNTFSGVTVVDTPTRSNTSTNVKIISTLPVTTHTVKRIQAANTDVLRARVKDFLKIKAKGKRGRKKYTPHHINYEAPVKILPKPICSSVLNFNNGQKIMKSEDKSEPKSKTVDKLVQQILNENTNEIDIFFKCMATSVKKLHPSLIPKVKMEVCNVIARYEMQNYDSKKDKEVSTDRTIVIDASHLP